MNGTYNLTTVTWEIRHPLASKAIASPGQTFEEHFTENGYDYSGTMTYDAATKILTVTGNVNWWSCPNWSGHHIGMLCQVCGNDERKLWSIRQRNRRR